MTAIGTEVKKEKFPRMETPGKGKLLLSKRLQGQIDYLHAEVGGFEWIGILLYKKVEGDISDPSTLVLRADRLFLMDIGTPGHTQATVSAEEVLNMYDEVPDILELKQGLIHTHHTMETFFSEEDWSELNDNTPLHNYYLSLIVNFKGGYTAKVAYMADVVNEFKFNNCDDNPVSNIYHKKVLMTITMDVVKEAEVADQDFMNRHKKIKEDKKKSTTYFRGDVQVIPYTGYTRVCADENEWGEYGPKEDQGEVGQKEKTFRGGTNTNRKGSSTYYQHSPETISYNQAREICLDWLNEGLRNEALEVSSQFNTITEGLAHFEDYYNNKHDGAEYRRFINMMQKTLVEVTTEHQPSLTGRRLETLLKDYSYGYPVSGSKVVKDLMECAKAHPVYLKIIRQNEKDRVEDTKSKFAL